MISFFVFTCINTDTKVFVRIVGVDMTQVFTINLKAGEFKYVNQKGVQSTLAIHGCSKISQVAKNAE